MFTFKGHLKWNYGSLFITSKCLDYFFYSFHSSIGAENVRSNIGARFCIDTMYMSAGFGLQRIEKLLRLHEFSKCRPNIYLWYIWHKNLFSKLLLLRLRFILFIIYRKQNNKDDRLSSFEIDITKTNLSFVYMYTERY